MRGYHSIIVSVLGLACATQAQAQNVGESLVAPDLPLQFDRGRNESVLDRARPEYEALGLQLGSFTLFPRVDTELGFSDNVYAIRSPRTGDGYVTVAPRASLSTNATTYALDLSAGYAGRRYFSETQRDENTWFAGANGRLDATSSVSFAGRFRASRLVEPRTSAAVPLTASEPIQYRQNEAGATASFTGGKARGQLSFDYNGFTFSDVRTFGGTVLDQASRNRDVYRGAGRGEISVSADTSVFVQLGYEKSDYRVPLSVGVPNRTSDQVRALLGASFDVSSLIRGAISAGYVRRNYTASIYPDISGWAAEGRVQYFASPLTTITATVRRTVEDASFQDTSGFFATSGSVRADHELLRNLLLYGQAGYEVDTYQGTGATVPDVKIWRAGAGARYFLNRTIGLAFSFSHDSRTSNAVANAYTENRGLISIVFQR